MVPVTSYCTVNGIPVKQFISPERLAAICARTAGGGGEIVKLMGTSAYYAPATAAVVMAESFLSDQKRLVPAAVYCNGEYGISDLYIGLPCVIGKGGIEKVWRSRSPRTRRRSLARASPPSVSSSTPALDCSLLHNP
jgi:malate dehydrogenase